MRRRNLVLLLAIISFICLGFIAQANFFTMKIDTIKRENTILSAENTKKDKEINELQERNRALEEELQTKIVYFEGDGNYTQIVTINKLQAVVCLVEINLKPCGFGMFQGVADKFLTNPKDIVFDLFR